VGEAGWGVSWGAAGHTLKLTAPIESHLACVYVVGGGVPANSV
jgi:hypothetical protein